MSSYQSKGLAAGTGVLVLLVLGLAVFGLDLVLAVLAVLLPTAMGVTCAVQAFSPPKRKHHRRWRAVFVITGILISGTVLWQQIRAGKRAEEDRKAVEEGRKKLQDEIAILKQDIKNAQVHIKDVSASFEIRVPLDHPALHGYRDRLEKCGQEIVATNTLKCGAQPRTVSITGEGIKDFNIPTTADIFPNQKSELVAFTLLSTVGIKVTMFKEGLPTVEQFEQAQPDLKFVLVKTLSLDENHNKLNDTAYISLFYDIPNKNLFVQGSRVPVDDSKSFSTLKIVSVEDLRGAYLVFQPILATPSLVSPAGGTTPEFETAFQISLTVVLEKIAVRVAQGVELIFSKEQLKKTTRGPVPRFGFYAPLPFYAVRINPSKPPDR